MPDRALHGTRVIEYAQFVSGPYCAKVLADLGAEVIKIEPPEGDMARRWGPFPGDVAHHERSGVFLYNNTNKRGLTLDPASPADRDRLRDLITDADVFIEDTTPGTLEAWGLDYASLTHSNPRLVMTSITPFGQTGPYSRYKAYHLNVSHAGGLGHTCPQFPGDLSILEREPVKEGGLIAEYDCATCAAAATLAALYLARTTGTGQHIDVSKQEALLHLLRPEMAMYFATGHKESRADDTLVSGWTGVQHCKDGYLFLFVVEEQAWQAFVETIGSPQWASDEQFATAEKRREMSADEVRARIGPWLDAHSRHELFHGLQRRRCPAAPLFKVGEVPHEAHLKAREFFITIEHPEAGTLSYPSGLAKFSATPLAFERPAPRLGQDNDAPSAARPVAARQPTDTETAATTGKPLDGVRITDLCWVWAGPSGTELLAYLGAEVIRVESASHICLTRRNTPWPWVRPPDVNQSITYNSLNFNKRGITVDLTRPEGIDLVKRLVGISDVVSDNYSGGMMQRFGLDYARLKEIKADIIAISMSGWGAYGPERDYRAYDPIFAALSGLYDLTGYPDREPGRSDNRGRLDLSAGTALALCIGAALLHRQRTGEGQFVDLSEWEAMACVLGDSYVDYFMNGRSPTRAGNFDPMMAPHNCYRCRGEDKWVSIAIATEGEWQAFCRAVGHEEWLHDPRFADASARRRNRRELDALISQWTAERTHYEVTELLQAAGVAAFPSMSREELSRDPHLLERGAYQEVDHPEAGRQTFLAPPWKLSATPAEIVRHSPLLGEDNEYVFCDLLGMPVEDFATLVGEGIIY